jgi:thiosulfate dehydrogenase
MVAATHPRSDQSAWCFSRAVKFGAVGWASCLLACLAPAVPTSVPLSPEDVRHLLEASAELPGQKWVEPDAATIPFDEKGEEIRRGIALLTHTSWLVGPDMADTEHRFAANNLNCINCHEAGPSGLPGTKPYVVPFVNAAHEYPKLDVKSMRVISLEERIVGMLGKGIAHASTESPEVRSIAAYIRWLGEGSLPGRRMQGTGLGVFTPPARRADPQAGKIIYMEKCAVCHGPQGLGRRSSDLSGASVYLYPPIAGNDSFDDGGHMYVVPVLARFIYAAMPYGATHDRPLLTSAQAYDVAAYVDSNMPRRHNPARSQSYPDPQLRPEGFAIPENFVGNEAAFSAAKFGPFKNP